MYCMRDGKDWWCVSDIIYDEKIQYLENDIELYKRNGDKYFINDDGVYEKRGEDE